MAFHGRIDIVEIVLGGKVSRSRDTGDLFGVDFSLRRH